jgi:IS6 family transposase
MATEVWSDPQTLSTPAGAVPKRHIEQDHRAIKRRINAKQGFRAFAAARRTIQGYEAMNMMRKGQIRWVPGTDVLRQIQFLRKIFGISS